MCGMVNFIIAAMAAFFLYDSGHAFPSLLAVLVAIVAFGSWGVMFRYDPRIRMKQLKRFRSTMLSQGRPPEEISRLDTYIKTSGQAGTPSVPHWLALVNYISFIGGFILLIWGVMSIVRGRPVSASMCRIYIHIQLDGCILNAEGIQKA